MIENKKSKIDKIIEREEKKKEPKVGIFFMIENKIWSHFEYASEADIYEGIRSVNYTFRELYNDLCCLGVNDINVKYNYAWYARGSVEYSVNEDTYYICIDKCLDKDEFKIKIINEFSLNDKNVKWKFDDYYSCYKCSNEIKRQIERVKLNDK